MKKHISAAALTFISIPSLAFQPQGGCDLNQQHAITGLTGGKIKNEAQAHISMRANMLQADLSNAVKAGAIPRTDASTYARKVEQIRKSALSQNNGISPASLSEYDRELDSITNYICNNDALKSTTNQYTLIIFYDEKSGKKQLLDSVSRYGGEVIYDYKNFNSLAVKIANKPKADAIHYFQGLNGVLQVNLDEKQSLHVN